MIVLGDRPEKLSQWCDSVEVLAKLNDPFGSAFERHPVLLCRGLKQNLQNVWPKLKDWD
jgi:hypothetical protein